MRIIVNADDLGISETVNAATFALIAAGRVTSATLLANGPAIDDALRLVPHFPACSFGLHLNLIEFAPLSLEAAPHLSRHGEMSRQILCAARRTPSLLQAVYRELCAQTEKLLRAGVTPTHFDSHQHVHTFPWMFPVLKALQSRYHVRRVRSTRNIYAPSEGISASLRLKKALFNAALRYLGATRTTDGFTDLPALLSLTDAQSRRFRSVEVMVHPGARDSEAETALLETDWHSRLPFRTSLIGYRQL